STPLHSTLTPTNNINNKISSHLISSHQTSSKDNSSFLSQQILYLPQDPTPTIYNTHITYTPPYTQQQQQLPLVIYILILFDLRNQALSVVATTRRLPSDSGAFADWAATTSSSGRAVPVDDLSLGFNAAPSAAAAAGPAAGMWSTAARSINYPEMGMFVVAPASSFHHHHQPPPHDPVMADSLNPATALGVGVIPLLAATPCLESDNVLGNRTRGGGIQFWQDQPPHQGHYLKKQHQQGLFNLDHDNASSGNLVQSSGGVTASGTNSGGTTCQDCGNQAKKDCSNRRCRTCCKSRGYDCPTHVKSTWVPAARRRERQLMATTAAVAGSSGSTSGTKKPRLIASQTTTTSHTSTSNTTPPRSFDTSSSHQDAGFKESLPGQVRAPAVFKCVRVTAVEDGQDEYAYQAVVKIGGHVFKGFLYDQGVENRDVYPNLSELHLGGGRNGVSSSSPMMDPSDVYAASGGGLLGGSSAY
ncbi:Protein LATERAL ROOT PRIMORDIUM 1, partial [Mucuna pruriens]